MRMKLGPMTVGYEGTAQMGEVDEDEYSATIDVRAKEVKGQGSASARIRNQLRGGDGITHVSVITDLNITGRPAQFGRGIMEDVATRMLADFAKRLEAEVSRPAVNGGGAAPEAKISPDVESPTEQPGPAASAQESTPAASAQDSTPASSAQESHEARAEPPALDLGGVIAGPLAKRGAIAALAVLVLLALLGLGRRRPRGLTVTVSYR
jgi:hypothetical protein